MDLAGWEERYRTRGEEAAPEPPTPLVMETARRMRPGRALDLACGVGRNAIWLAEHGWQVTAVDGSESAIETLHRRAGGLGLTVQTHVADLERHDFRIEPGAWDMVAICYYLQRDLFEPAKAGVAPGGVILAIVHITEPGEEATQTRLRPGELAGYFEGWEILHRFEGAPNDPAHRHRVAEIVARKNGANGY